MSRAVFKHYGQGQVCMFPGSLDEKIPENSPVRLLNQIVANLDISEIVSGYKGGGCSSYNPRMLLKLVL
jgi:transposase